MRVKVEMNSKGEVKTQRIEIPIQGGGGELGQHAVTGLVSLISNLKEMKNRARVRTVIKHGLRLGGLLPTLRIFDRKEYRRRYAHGRGTGRN